MEYTVVLFVARNKNNKHNIEYQFTDKTIFDNASKVVFCIKDKIIEDAELVDTSWSDRTFGFEVDLGEIPWIEEQIL